MTKESMTFRIEEEIGSKFKIYCDENGYSVKGKLSIILKEWFVKEVKN